MSRTLEDQISRLRMRSSKISYTSCTYLLSLHLDFRKLAGFLRVLNPWWQNKVSCWGQVFRRSQRSSNSGVDGLTSEERSVDVRGAARFPPAPTSLDVGLTWMFPRPSDIQVIQVISRIFQVISRIFQVIFRISQVIFKLTWLFPRPADRRDCWAGASASTAHTSVADEDARGIHDINNRETKTPNNCQIFLMWDHLNGNHCIDAQS